MIAVLLLRCYCCWLSLSVSVAALTQDTVGRRQGRPVHMATGTRSTITSNHRLELHLLPPHRKHPCLSNRELPQHLFTSSSNLSHLTSATMGFSSTRLAATPRGGGSRNDKDQNKNDINYISSDLSAQRSSKRVNLLTGAVAALTIVAGFAKLGWLPGPLLLETSSTTSVVPYTTTYLLQDAGMTILTAILGYVFVYIITTLAVNEKLDPKDARKLIHTGSAPLFMLFWPFFSTATGSQCWAAIVPLLNAVRLYRAAQGGDKIETTIADSSINDTEANLRKAVSRSGDASEALGGPFIYVLWLAAEILCLWRSAPVGIVALATLAAGDGVADLVGRRWGASNQWPGLKKSVVGSMAFWVASWAVSAGLLQWMQYWDCMSELAVSHVILRLAIVTLIAAIVELIPIADDNYTVPLSAGLAAFFLLPLA